MSRLVPGATKASGVVGAEPTQLCPAWMTGTDSQGLPISHHRIFLLTNLGSIFPEESLSLPRAPGYL